MVCTAAAGRPEQPSGHREMSRCSQWPKQLKETQKTFQQRIQQREKDVQQLRETVESHKRSAQTAVEDRKAAVSRAEGRLERLEQEINDLRRRDAELEQLSHTQDHIQFLQSFQSLSAPPESTDENDKPFISLFSSDGLRESVHQLRDKLEDFCKEELKKISDRVTVTFTNIVPRTRKDFPQYSHQLTLDLNTAHKRLRLSDRNKIPAILKDESVGAIVLHAGVTDIWLRQTEVLKRDFGSLIETVRSAAPETRIIVQAPLPTYRLGTKGSVDFLL
ncbi:hypothetical protein QQF64_014282 [Cirrhinus molitorella]|uniref:TRIM8/14/16/25/29/45/65 coiled-coil region domain-containing protein n=1 Tax=Cirrhinus molitorella TaxID=172907 RepID=A0ABR3NS40_9TELE